MTIRETQTIVRWTVRTISYMYLTMEDILEPDKLASRIASALKEALRYYICHRYVAKFRKSKFWYLYIRCQFSFLLRSEFSF